MIGGHKTQLLWHVGFPVESDPRIWVQGLQVTETKKKKVLKNSLSWEIILFKKDMWTIITQQQENGKKKKLAFDWLFCVPKLLNRITTSRMCPHLITVDRHWKILYRSSSIEYRLSMNTYCSFEFFRLSLTETMLSKTVTSWCIAFFLRRRRAWLEYCSIVKSTLMESFLCLVHVKNSDTADSWILGLFDVDSMILFSGVHDKICFSKINQCNIMVIFYVNFGHMDIIDYDIWRLYSNLYQLGKSWAFPIENNRRDFVENPSITEHFPLLFRKKNRIWIISLANTELCTKLSINVPSNLIQ